MLSRAFNYSLFRLQRPEWVPELEFDDAVNLLRAARVLADLLALGGWVRRDLPNGFLLLHVFEAEPGKCFLRFRWNEPYAREVTVVVR